MQTEIWKLEPQSAFHFGRHGLGQEESEIFLTSDTLFSALVSICAAVKGPDEVESFVQKFTSSSPLCVFTSAFPRAGEVCFFPLPLSALGTHTLQLEKIGWETKKLKKVRFVSGELFRQYVQGVSLVELLAQSCSLQNESLLYLPQELSGLPPALRQAGGNLWSIGKRPRVTVGRLDQRSTLFHTGQLFFAPQCGLWFGLRWLQQEKKLAALLQELFQILGDSGIGAERSAGLGKALIRRQEQLLDLPDARADSAWVTLSRYLPAEDEMAALQDGRAVYQLQPAGGWLLSAGQKAQRRRVANLLAEGSVLGPVAKPVPGQAADVCPSYEGSETFAHPVWRSGMAFAVPLKKALEMEE